MYKLNKKNGLSYSRHRPGKYQAALSCTNYYVSINFLQPQEMTKLVILISTTNYDISTFNKCFDKSKKDIQKLISIIQYLCFRYFKSAYIRYLYLSILKYVFFLLVLIHFNPQKSGHYSVNYFTVLF